MESQLSEIDLKRVEALEQLEQLDVVILNSSLYADGLELKAKNTIGNHAKLNETRASLSVLTKDANTHSKAILDYDKPLTGKEYEKRLAQFRKAKKFTLPPARKRVSEARKDAKADAQADVDEGKFIRAKIHKREGERVQVLIGLGNTLKPDASGLFTAPVET